MRPLSSDAYIDRYASRTRGMTASEIRALFSVASRPEVVSLAGGMPYVSALDQGAVGRLAAEVIAEHGDEALQYGSGQGLPALRERLVDVMAAEGVPAHADDIVVTTGGQQALDLVGKLFCDPGDVVLAEGPTYVGALGAFGAYQPEIVHVAMDDDGLVPESVAAAVARLASEGRTAKFLYTVPNHQNPAGSSLSVARRHALVELAERYDLLVVEDNPYGLLDFKGEVRPSLRSLAPDRVVYLGTLSKILSPGLRVGWIAASEPLRDKLVLLKEAADLCQSNLTQHLAARWFAQQPWQAQVSAFREVYRVRCEAMLTELEAAFPDGCRWTSPTGGFFVWVELPETIDTRELLARALQERVAYVPGSAFFAGGGGTSAMRLSFCFPPEARIREGVRRLGELVDEELALAAALYRRTPR